MSYLKMAACNTILHQAAHHSDDGQFDWPPKKPTLYQRQFRNKSIYAAKSSFGNFFHQSFARII